MTSHESGNGGGNPPHAPFDSDEQLHLDVERLKNRADTADLEKGAFITAISNIERAIKEGFEQVHHKLDAVIADHKLHVKNLRTAKSEIETLKTERYRDKLESYNEIHNEIHDTENRMKLEARDAAKVIAAEEAKHAVTTLHLDITKGQVADLKDDGRWLRRFIAEKGVSAVIGALGAVALVVITYLLSKGH